MSSEIKREILRLLKEDEEFRYAVAGAIGLSELLKRMDRFEEELVKLRQDLNVLRQDLNVLRQEVNQSVGSLGQEMNQSMDAFRQEVNQNMNALRQEMNQSMNVLRQEVNQNMGSMREEMRGGFERLERRMTALGARWGVDSEETFREAMRGILSEELGVKVDRWVAQDDEGLVYGYPSAVEVDVAITDGRTVLIEVSSHVRKADVFLFLKKAQFYEKRTGRRPDRLIFVSPFVEDPAAQACGELGIEVYSKT